MRRMSSRSIETAELRAAVADGRVWGKLGIVITEPGGDSHFQKVTDDSGNTIDVLVCVRAAHTNEVLWCRLGSGAGGNGGYGIWRIPPEKTEVAVLVPEGELEGAPVIVSTLSSFGVPQSLDDAILLISHSAKVRIETNNADVEIVASGGQVVLQPGGEQPIARKTDPVDIGTFSHTPASGAGVSPCQLVWTPPGGGLPTTITSLGADLTGQVKDGSSNAKSG